MAAPPTPADTAERAALHAALGDPVRLALVDDLMASDRSSQELAARHGIASNLVAHHLDVLEGVGLVERSRSSGDGRRRYVHLDTGRLAALAPAPPLTPTRAVFVCTANSARSQLAAALWHDLTGAPASSAGTHPAPEVHPLAVAAARRAGLDLAGATPRALRATDRRAPLVVTVCDRAHEEVDVGDTWLHWSVPDPVAAGDRAAFDATVAELRTRIAAVTGLGEEAA
jgi:protein-tyrosine-phosphatase